MSAAVAPTWRKSCAPTEIFSATLSTMFPSVISTKVRISVAFSAVAVVSPTWKFFAETLYAVTRKELSVMGLVEISLLMKSRSSALLMNATVPFSALKSRCENAVDLPFGL